MNRNNIKVYVQHKVEVNKEFEVIVRIPKEYGIISDLKVLFNKNGENPKIIKELHKTKEEEFENEYSTQVCLNEVAEFFFFFSVVINGSQRAIKISRETNEPFVTDGESPYWSILVHNNFSLPDWAKGKLFYQIFVDRFFNSPNYENSGKKPGRQYKIWGAEVDWGRNRDGHFHNNDFYCGNLKGIEEKLEYLHELGVEVLYLSPINASSYRYDRYATVNFMEIDEDVGTFEDLDALHKKAAALGMHIILDIAFNHCHVDNPIYQDAINNENSIYKDWFAKDSNGNIRFWYGFGDMPEFNQLSKGYQEYVYGENGVIAKYSKYVDGFRLDLAEALEPFFLEGIRNRANTEKVSFIVGEWWQDVSNEVLGRGIDAPTCYPLTNAVLKYLAYGESDTLERKMKELVDSYPQETLDSLLLSLSTHDIIRALTILAKKQYMRTGFMDIWKIDEAPSPWHGYNSFDTDGFRSFEAINDKLSKEEYEKGKELLKLGVIIQYFYLGNPCVFYGEEAGLSGWKDPFNRKCYPWREEDKELLDFYKRIGQFRKQVVLTNCNPEILYRDSELFIFKRENEHNSIFVAVNRGDSTRKLEVPEEFKDGKIFVLNGDINYLYNKGGIIIIKQHD